MIHIPAAFRWAARFAVVFAVTFAIGYFGLFTGEQRRNGRKNIERCIFTGECRPRSP